MNKTNNLLVSLASFFLREDADVVNNQHHIDEKRNVKQPPLLPLLSNFIVKFYSQQHTVVSLS
jgi:hypothetical protein